MRSLASLRSRGQRRQRRRVARARKLALAVLGLTSTVTLSGSHLASVPSQAEVLRLVSSSPCADVVLYGVRGSGQELRVEDAGFGRQAFSYAEQIGEVVSAAGLTVQVRANTYPAVSVQDALDGGASEGRLWRSVETGVRQARRDLAALREQCPGTTKMLIGYSQGAAVGHLLLERLGEAARLDGAVLLADPLRGDGPQAEELLFGAAPDAGRGHRAAARGDTAFADSALAGSVPTALPIPALSVCNLDDRVCNEPWGAPGFEITEEHTESYQGDDPSAVMARSQAATFVLRIAQREH